MLTRQKNLLEKIDRVHIGTSGYNYKHWKGIFYPDGLPQKEWMRFYSNYFDTVEINATFYRSFKKEVYQKWRSETKDSFGFVIKGPRRITHIKRLVDVKEELDYFYETSLELKEKYLGVLWQFPYSFKLTNETKDNLTQFISKLPTKPTNFIEFRNLTWYQDSFLSFLDEKSISLVVSDSPRFQSKEIVSGQAFYIRFHGPSKLYASEYTKDQLKEWARKIKEYKKNNEVFCFFNNDNKGYAVKNGLELKKLVL